MKATWPQFIRDLFYPILKRVTKKDVFSNLEDKKPLKSIYDYEVLDIEGKEVSLRDFEGKKLLIVNTASACGFTSQYTQLEQLYKMHKDELVVLAFPSNDFGKQEPGSNANIAIFCTENYDVSFPLFSKIKVKGEDAHPIYKWLSDPKLNGWNKRHPSWNFCKYLVDEHGVLQHCFNAPVDPFHPLIVSSHG